MSESYQQNRAGNGGVAVIGRGMVIKGSVHSKQDVFIDGELEGSLVVENCSLTIGPHGRAVANAKARAVDIQGTLEGNVESSENIAIRTGGRLVGDIKTAGIVIEDGAYFKGGVDIVTRRAQEKTAGDA